MSDWPNVRAFLKAYLRADTGVSASAAGTRTFYGVPRSGAKYPLITITGQVGGGQDASEAPIDRPLYQLDILGDDLDEMHAVESAVRASFEQIRGPVTLDQTVVYGVNVIGAVDFPDPLDDRPRRVLTLDVAARSA